MADLQIPIKPNNVTWTDDQWKAIMAKNRDILVAAAAGSGKTAVLVERIIQKVLSADDPVNVDELLVVTFTNASAAEMRHRIGEALEKAIQSDPQSRHLRMQLSLLNKASISTLHSFCLEVIRRYYYLIDIDPGFRIADETEAQLLRDEVMDELFEEEYGKKDNDAFFRLVDAFTSDRSDASLMEIVRFIYDFSMSNPLPEKYLQSIVEMYETSPEEGVEDLPFVSALLYDIELQLINASELIEKALEMSKLPGGPAPRALNYMDDLQLINTLSAAKKDSWQTLYNAMQTISFSTAKQCRGDDFNKELVEEAGKLRDKAKKIINGLKDELFTRRPESFLRDMTEMLPLIETLVSLVKSFASRFSEAKRERGLVDFADLEHYCLAILAENVTDSGEFLPSEAAVSYRNHFKEVLVDEYQDTNMVQETVLKLVAKGQDEPGNRFMVGDVKQSIYRFRLAEPNLFLGKYNKFDSYGNTSGLRIDLSRNFRSRKEVLDGTNYIFKQIMGVNVGEIEYDESAELKLGAPYPEENIPVELMLIERNDAGEDLASQGEDSAYESEFDRGELEQSQLEAKAMAQKIKELIENKTPVFNAKTKTNRPLKYKDVVILLRSMTWAPQIMEEFKQQGIPIYANLSTGYFEATEIAIMMSLLRVIDNPYQDIPLASVLRSPIVGLNEEELAQLRIYNKRGSYWEAVEAYTRSSSPDINSDLQDRLALFSQMLGNWRAMARQGSLSELVWQLYRDTQFYDFAGGLPGGKQRQANLRALYDRARQYEETSFRGLFRFLRFIERMMERGDDLGAARALGEQEDVVRLMTIHSSKGLEFPVVFIAGLSRQFNQMDIRKSYLIDKDFGFAAKYVDPIKRISYPSLPQIAFKRKKRMEMLAEEMRVLYVALTRAKERLYMIASIKDTEKKLEQWKTVSSHPDWLLKDYERASANSYLDWVGPTLFRHQDCVEDLTNLIPEEISAHPSLWKINRLNAEELVSREDLEEEEQDTFLELVEQGKVVPIESTEAQQVFNMLSWEYSFQDAATHRSKQSVSEMKRHREIADENSGTDLLRKFKKTNLNRPRFMQEKTITPAERGTALHMVMQHVDFSKPVTVPVLQELLSSMVKDELLTDEQLQVIEPELIVQFFNSELGHRLHKAKYIKREIPFTMSLPAKEVYMDWKEENESIFVQGVIDCVFEDELGLVLLDYKSDTIHGRYKGGFEQARPLIENRYKMQIDLYTKALEQIWKRKVDERYLFLFDGAHIMNI
ncbi:helicase-exonuclease AddAB subunit AddA [Neobacillus terrae]|uniref:helicase-exonuclease AddAB subunit AddA n=1 Tax=Neobacillus terrae TaxID=3034837 RepID=UPI00140C6E3F|nr:helicase-exonuclease AddAB subunit AddA [Neobacillus terrae]NHM31712.1 helicase-exonuclease AddAB subunit AddA [Neobacillus terrae]